MSRSPSRCAALLLAGVCACDGTLAGGPPADIAVAASTGELALPALVDVQVAGEGLAVSLDGSVGTVSLFGERSPAAIYAMTAGPSTYTLYQALRVRGGGLSLLWFYCRNGRVEYGYFEDTAGGGLQSRVLFGSCVERSGPARATVSFPSLSMNRPPAITGYAVAGVDISLTPGQPGTITWAGQTWDLIPFVAVDCSTCDDRRPGWHELHSLLWDASAGRLAVAILYLDRAEPDAVTVGYAITLPDLSNASESGEVLPATWTTPAP